MTYRGNPQRERRYRRAQDGVRAAAGLELERDYYPGIFETARVCGWPAVYHTQNSRGSDPGFPDFLFLRERLVVAEVKGPDTPVTPAQLVWQERFRAAGVETHLWRLPADLALVDRTLGARLPGPTPERLALAEAGQAARDFIAAVHRRHLATGEQPRLSGELWTPFETVVKGRR